MATTKIFPLYQSKGKTLAQSLKERIEYGTNSEKTEGGALVTSYACDWRTAAAEFALAKREYRELTGRVQESDIIAYQTRQSFKPGEVTPEEANRIGYEFAERFLKGNHAFIVCTHTDKAHIHNHIYWNSTSLDCTRKFRNFIGSYRAVRTLSDLICIEHRLSVVLNPKRHGLSYNKWLGDKGKPSNRDMLRVAIDEALAKKPKDFDEFVQLLGEAGYTMRRKKTISFRHESQGQNIRLSSLGAGYSEEELRAVLSGEKPHNPFSAFSRNKYLKQKGNRLITDIEVKLETAKNQWAAQDIKTDKIKQMAKTVLYMEQHGLSNYEELDQAYTEVEQKFLELKSTIKSAEARMSEIQTLRTHIINYAKTREVYAAYRKAGYSKKFLAEHEADIILHKAAKNAFDEGGFKKIPTVKSLSEEFAELLSTKKSAYAEYRKLQSEMKELSIHRANLAYINGLGEENETSAKRQKEISDGTSRSHR